RKQAKSRTSGWGCWQDTHPPSSDTQAVLSIQLNRLGIQLTLCCKHPRCERFDGVVIVHRHGGLQDNGPMIIARIGEVDRTTTELHPRLEHSAVYTVTIQPLPSKSRQQSWMDIYDTPDQGWRWLVER